ncbi:hypothetical protein [Sinorhizobium americanum]|uniref:Uncharacterized protein n=1 Tax=Sinorhizobium americanum TaxID=194963 RepID=A0A4R2BLL3_9HYPH|nr:hypothetical protein [Sinorhizobium americanum]TCN27605.1 hypothetical protein EV184_11563 [Sinorhizobium americanum]
MKVPQRSFIVEFKSGRRQAKARTNSIWGDTDLKALARAVEEESSHLFNSTEVPVTPDASGDMVSQQIDVGSAGEHSGDNDVAAEAVPSDLAAGTEEQKQREAERLADEPVVEETQPASRPQATSTRRTRKRARHAPARAIAPSSTHSNERQNEQSTNADDATSLEEVTALDAENKRLKRLLAEQLYAQNLQLKRMLERFDVI